jgi:hypothetical protein
LEAIRCGGRRWPETINPASNPIVTPRCSDDLEADCRPKLIKILVIFQLVDVPTALSAVVDSVRSEVAADLML